MLVAREEQAQSAREFAATSDTAAGLQEKVATLNEQLGTAQVYFVCCFRADGDRVNVG